MSITISLSVSVSGLTYQQPSDIDLPRCITVSNDRLKVSGWDTHVGYADKNSARDEAMHKLQIPAVTRPVPRQHCRIFHKFASNIPQTTLAGPPEGKLRDKLADRAVHDYHRKLAIHSISSGCISHTLRIAKARPSIDLDVSKLAAIRPHQRHKTYNRENWRFNSALWPIWANCASSSTWSFIVNCTQESNKEW